MAVRRERFVQDGAAAYYRSLFWAATDAILVADEHGHYLDANQAAATLLGYSRDALLCLNVADVVASGPEWAANEYAQYLQDGTWSGELELRRHDGTLVPVEAHATVVPRQAGPPAFLSVIRDISQRRAAEQAQREFLAMVTHELRSPLTAILGHAQLMTRRGTYSARSAESIVTQAQHLQRMLADLADVAHLAAGQPELRRSTVDVAALAREAVAQETATATTHQINLEIPAQPIIGSWDADRVTQVLRNLLSNATKYSPAGSTIGVRVEASSDQAIVAVRDQGEGITPDELPRLFERFYRTPAANRGNATGMGLGLHICKLMVEAHGGRIWIESTLGKGTTISFMLPFAQTDAG